MIKKAFILFSISLFLSIFYFALNPRLNKNINEGLDKKFQVAKDRSFANYSFYLGTTNDNIEEIKKTAKRACCVKIFMGASTGNMLVDNIKSLENIFTA